MTASAAASMAEAAAKFKASASDDTMANLANRFGALSVEQPSQSFLAEFANASYERPKPLDDDPIVYEAEASKSLEDIMLAFTIFGE